MAQAVPLAAFDDLIPLGARLALADRPWLASILPGGRKVNLCLALEDGSGDVAVLRVRRPPVLPGADFAREVACHRRAAAAGLAPSIRASDVKEGWVLMDRAPGVAWTPAMLNDEASIDRLGERLRSLHALEAPDFPPASGLALLRENCDLLALHGESGTAALLKRAGELTARLALLPPRPRVLCHGDPDAANFIGPRPLLIDFEYAQVADPTYDLALLLDYYPAIEARLERVQRAMGLDDDASLRRLPLQRELCGIVNGAWARAQELLSQGVRLD